MEKDKALEAALGQIERAFGKGSIMRLGQDTKIDIEAISTGSLGIDIALAAKETQSCEKSCPKTSSKEKNKKMSQK